MEVGIKFTIFIKKFKGIKLNAKLLNDEDLSKIKIHENIILEDLDEKVDEKLVYSLFNIIDLDNKFIIVLCLYITRILYTLLTQTSPCCRVYTLLFIE